MATLMQPDGLKIRFLGINGFEFQFGGKTLLIDPYVTRDSKRLCNPELVRKHISRADYILITHSHWDHLADVPEIAKFTDCVIFGTMTTLNICRYFKIPESRLRLLEAGRPMEVAPFTAVAIPAEHKLPSGFPGIYAAVPPKVEAAADYLEGTTWAFKIGCAGNSFLNIGSAGMVEGELKGMACDYLMASVAGRDSTFLARLLGLVTTKNLIPVHWDNYESKNPEIPGSYVNLEVVSREVEGIAPGLPVRVLAPLETMELEI